MAIVDVCVDAVVAEAINWYVGRNKNLDEENVTKIKDDMAGPKDIEGQVFQRID